jgi:HPt (histidine-containing phosphotransfer) domain-containing protein
MTNGWAHLLAQAPDDLQAMLMQSVRDDLHAAFVALTAGDAARVAYLAHRLKGSARLCGDKAATALCAALEGAEQTSDFERVQLLLMALERAFGTAWPAARQAARVSEPESVSGWALQGMRRA